ncbi:MAG: Na+/H+ antiporter NhaA [Alphaproteobacteria bacterium]
MSHPHAPFSTGPRGIIPPNLKRFMALESSSGVTMILCAILAMLAANSIFSDWYKELVSIPITFGLGGWSATEALKDWVKDILMVFFFLMIGLELKREMKEGFLAQRDQILLPLLAAASGMAVPALIFLGLNANHPETIHGWAIPAATDIAFAIAILSLFGRHIPPSVKVFLLAVAIFDDLGAILIIAAFYNTGLTLLPLALAAMGLIALYLMNRSGVATLAPYMVIGLYLWGCFYQAGIHTTMAGVIVGLAIPMRDDDHPTQSPVNRALYFLLPWVSFFVLPIFAFTAAGVSLQGLGLELLLAPLPLGVAMGLFVGKQIGIFGICLLLIHSRLIAMPEGARWRDIYAVSIVAGIGFTMSLFISLLAYQDPALQELAKIGTLTGSMLAILWSIAVMRWNRPRFHSK